MSRAYTVGEIDRMRAALRKRAGWIDVLWGETVEMNDARRHRWESNIEDKLRTYMIGGINPDELEITP